MPQLQSPMLPIATMGSAVQSAQLCAVVGQLGQVSKDQADILRALGLVSDSLRNQLRLLGYLRLGDGQRRIPMC